MEIIVNSLSTRIGNSRATN